MVLSFSSQAIKTENAATVQCDAFQIEIFSQQEEPWCQQEEPWCQQLVLLVAVASMTYQFMFSQLFFSLECLLRRVATGAKKMKKLQLNAVSPSPPLSKYMLIL